MTDIAVRAEVTIFTVGTIRTKVNVRTEITIVTVRTRLVTINVPSYTRFH